MIPSYLHSHREYRQEVQADLVRSYLALRRAPHPAGPEWDSILSDVGERGVFR